MARHSVMDSSVNATGRPDRFRGTIGGSAAELGIAMRDHDQVPRLEGPSEIDMAGVNFRIGDVFPHEDVVSQFLTGLCMVVNDVTLTMRQMDRIRDTREGQSGVNTYYLYLTCAYYREAAHFLELGLKNAEVTSFLADLSPDGRDHLKTVTDSFTPWNGSFVKDKLKPIRNVVFHYKPLSLDRMRPYLKSASGEESHIELGQGTYLETRYEFADAVFVKYVLDVWGRSESELRDIMKQVVTLVLALMYFAHEAVTARLAGVDQDAFEVTKRTV